MKGYNLTRGILYNAGPSNQVPSHMKAELWSTIICILMLVFEFQLNVWRI